MYKRLSGKDEGGATRESVLKESYMGSIEAIALFIRPLGKIPIRRLKHTLQHQLLFNLLQVPNSDFRVVLKYQ